MHRTGTIQRWDAERGYGFIRGAEGGADVFFHARDYRGGGAPAVGMGVRFEQVHVGGKGPRAMAVAPTAVRGPARGPAADGGTARATGRPPRPPRAPSSSDAPLPGEAAWRLASVLWLALLAGGVWLGRLHWPALLALAALNVATVVVYALDKSSAQTGRRRTPENTLHLLALAGGWPGARLAQSALRHKSRKRGFQQAYALTVVLHLGALAAWVGWAAR